ncbi:hypothetical protein HELRODRAFT_169974 [Helobdella robusta]|uniref:N-terminal Ras-GEF domain-containing protein n=1 Tax=Helobdella robusta TaxID=6412 RepID=T1F2H9_HELRO|nr:hypothetical protein HELRODRAFT_169974 [Helobdella robusta]ESO08235.1 hypothetical protein HELRODRAFT_169974 [Helobdella robusta]
MRGACDSKLQQRQQLLLHLSVNTPQQQHQQEQHSNSHNRSNISCRDLEFSLSMDSKAGPPVTFTFLAASLQEKNAWCSDISQCIENLHYGGMMVNIYENSSTTSSSSLSSSASAATTTSQTFKYLPDPRLFKDDVDIKFSRSLNTCKEPQIRQATVNRLLDRLTDLRFFSSDFLNTFLTTYRVFTTSAIIIDALRKIYRNPEIGNLQVTACPTNQHRDRCSLDWRLGDEQSELKQQHQQHQRTCFSVDATTQPNKKQLLIIQHHHIAMQQQQRQTVQQQFQHPNTLDKPQFDKLRRVSTGSMKASTSAEEGTNPYKDSNCNKGSSKKMLTAKLSNGDRIISEKTSGASKQFHSQQPQLQQPQLQQPQLQQPLLPMLQSQQQQERIVLQEKPTLLLEKNISISEDTTKQSKIPWKDSKMHLEQQQQQQCKVTLALPRSKKLAPIASCETLSGSLDFADSSNYYSSSNNNSNQDSISSSIARRSDEDGKLLLDERVGARSWSKERMRSIETPSSAEEPPADDVPAFPNQSQNNTTITSANDISAFSSKTFSPCLQRNSADGNESVLAAAATNTTNGDLKRDFINLTNLEDVETQAKRQRQFRQQHQQHQHQQHQQHQQLLNNDNFQFEHQLIKQQKQLQRQQQQQHHHHHHHFLQRQDVTFHEFIESSSSSSAAAAATSSSTSQRQQQYLRELAQELQPSFSYDTCFEDKQQPQTDVHSTFECSNYRTIQLTTTFDNNNIFLVPHSPNCLSVSPTPSFTSSSETLTGSRQQLSAFDSSNNNNNNAVMECQPQPHKPNNDNNDKTESDCQISLSTFPTSIALSPSFHKKSIVSNIWDGLKGKISNNFLQHQQQHQQPQQQPQQQSQQQQHLLPMSILQQSNSSSSSPIFCRRPQRQHQHRDCNFSTISLNSDNIMTSLSSTMSSSSSPHSSSSPIFFHSPTSSFSQVKRSKAFGCSKSCEMQLEALALSPISRSKFTAESRSNKKQHKRRNKQQQQCLSQDSQHQNSAPLQQQQQQQQQLQQQQQQQLKMSLPSTFTLENRELPRQGHFSFSINHSNNININKYNININKYNINISNNINNHIDCK